MIKRIITYFLLVFLLVPTSFLYANESNNKLIKIQSGLEKIDEINYKCKKDNCKINLIVDGFTDKNYLCSWDFGGGKFKTKNTDKKCNPGYVDYNNGNFELSLKIYNKNNLEKIVKEQKINILNKKIIDFTENKTYSNEVKIINNIKKGNILLPDIFGEKIKSSLYTGNLKVEENISSGKIITQSLDIEINTGILEKINPEIIVQSGLDFQTGNIWKCKNEKCKINLTASGFLDKDYLCNWSFSGGTFKTKDTEKKCNPGYVNYSTGEYEINLEIIDKNNNSIFGKNNILIQNIIEEEIEDFKTQTGVIVKEKVIIKTDEIGIGKEPLKVNKAPKAKIKLQGRLAVYKKLIGNKLICEGVDDCSVNLTGEDSYDEDKKTLKYYWNFGNLEKTNLDNPKSFYFSTGNHKIELKVVDKFGLESKVYFYVEVVPKIKKSKTIVNSNSEITKIFLDKNIYGNIKIYGVLPNNKGKDDREFIEIENISEKKINLKGLVIGDNSKKFTIKNNLYILANSKKKFYKRITKLTLGNKKDSVSLLCNGKILDKISWDFDVPDDFMLTHDNINLDLEEVYVERVIDGDTIKIKFKNNRSGIVRLIGIDTPETKDPRKELQFYGLEASEFTKNNLESKKVFLEYSKDNLSGKYSRILAYVYLDKNKNQNFNKILVEKGYARVYVNYPFKLKKDFLKSEKQAKKQKLGVWNNIKLKKDFQIVKKIKQNLKSKKEDNTFLFNKKDFINIKNNLKFDFNYNSIDISKNIGAKKWFNGKINNKINTKKVLVNHKKKLKKSIKYKISKNKKAFRISGNSSIYKKINLEFQGKEYILNTDKNNNFKLELKNIKSGDYKINFSGFHQKLGKIFIKQSRKIKLNTEYVNSIGKLKKKGRKTKNKKYIKNKKKKFKTMKLKQSAKEYIELFDIKYFILKVLLGILASLFFFMIFYRKKILQ